MIYLDNAATTQIDPQVLEAMQPYLGAAFGNPSSLYTLGREARQAIDVARRQVASYFAPQARVIFTSGGTESCNLALWGILLQKRQETGDIPHLLISAIEHSAVRNCAQELADLGLITCTEVPVDEFGFVDMKAYESAFRPETALVSMIYANNEVGTVQNLAELAAIAHEKGALFHTDACQAVAYLPLDLEEIGVDLVTINGGKIYGPKGVGALILRDQSRVLQPLLMGGGQESGLRSGTENVAAIIGLAKAMELVRADYLANAEKVAELRDLLWKLIMKGAENAWYTGARMGTGRLPNHFSLIIEGIEGESLLMRLDQNGIAASTGSACSSGSLEPSPVLKALGLTKSDMYSSLRLTLGKNTTKADVEAAAKVINREIKSLREVNFGI